MAVNSPSGDYLASCTMVASPDTCSHHSQAAGHDECHAFIRLGVICQQPVTTLVHYPIKRILLPVCSGHLYPPGDALKQGSCQARIAECGHLCLRLAEYNPPFNLCAEHAGGTDTLPCFLMKLPTELRLHIFRYLVPSAVPAYVFRGRVIRSSLHLCLTIFRKASADHVSLPSDPKHLE